MPFEVVTITRFMERASLVWPWLSPTGPSWKTGLDFSPTQPEVMPELQLHRDDGLMLVGFLSWALVICFSSFYFSLTRSHSFLFWCKFINGFNMINSMIHADHSTCVFSDRMCSSLDPVAARSVFSVMRWKPGLTSFQELQFIWDLILPRSPPLHCILLNSRHTATCGGNWKTIKAESLLKRSL